MMIVYSNVELNKPQPKPRYWVTDEKSNLLYESKDASTAIQWAIDHTAESIGIDGIMKLISWNKIIGRKENTNK